MADTHLAAIAAEHRAGIVTFEREFGRFEGARVDSPDDILRARKGGR
ncbi:hypothetical protein [Microbacterium suwonense]|nr:hypothetical protein [Microbacterium suwonense]